MNPVLRRLKRQATRLKRVYFNGSLDFGMQIFNVLAVGGAAISFIMAIVSALVGSGAATVVLNFASGLLALVLLKYANAKGHFRSACIFTITSVFLVVFPTLFFTGGGYRSGMPCFFIFAVVFTILMLNGRIVVFFVALELAVYAGCCVAAFYKPELVNALTSEEAVLTDSVTGFVVVSLVLGITVYFLVRAYRIQQKQLDERNLILSGMNRIKAEMISNVSHEMKTPLTVVSVNVQRALDMLGDSDAIGKTDSSSKIDPIAKTGPLDDTVHPANTAQLDEARALLQNSQDEVMRLARMVSGALRLASARESFDKKPLDCARLLINCAETFRVQMKRRGNALVCDVPASLPEVVCDADQVAQVLSNLLSNANRHTADGTITVTAAADDSRITVTVADTGEGIPPELMPHLFERGVSGGDGTGYGLCLCRAIIESHGGVITLSSAPDKGTSAVFELPVPTLSGE